MRNGFKKSSLSSSLNSTYTRSENVYGFKGPGLKTGMKYGWITGRHTPAQNSLEYSPPPRLPTKYPREILYLILTENLFQFCGSNYLQTHGTAMGTKMAFPFANIFMTRISI